MYYLIASVHNKKVKEFLEMLYEKAYIKDYKVSKSNNFWKIIKQYDSFKEAKNRLIKLSTVLEYLDYNYEYYDNIATLIINYCNFSIFISVVEEKNLDNTIPPIYLDEYYDEF